MNILLKAIFYALLVSVLFVLCLYQFPKLWEFINEKTDSQISDDIKHIVDDKINTLKGKSNLIDNSIENIAPKTTSGIKERLWDAQGIK